jgi:hypothetical protein
MKTRFVRLLSVSAAMLMPLSVAHAQATRTWVSGVGADENPCSRTAPCKTFAGAILKTATGGEISVLDSAGYGAVTITKSITIDGAGAHASILAALANGVIVNAAGSVVTLRNLSINGVGSGFDGIRFLAGAELHVENVVADRMTGKGIAFQPSNNAELFVSNSTFAHNAQGIAVTPGVGFTARATVENSRMVDNSGAGLRAERGAVVSVRNSVATGNTNGFVATGVGGDAFLQLENCGASHNSAAGIFAGLGGGGLTAFVSMSNCLVTGNANGLSADASGIIRSFGDNKVVDNTTDGTPSTPLLAFK